MTERKPYHLNVAGDFYVEDGCCLTCGIPQHFAPELFASLEEHDQCFVKRQPQSAAELARMIQVMHHQDIGCIRCRGDNEAVAAQLRAEGLQEYVDDPQA